MRFPCPLFILILGLSLPGWTPNPAVRNQPTEFHVKAAYLYLFGKYITWPADPKPDFTIGIYGPDPFGSIMEEVLMGKKVRGKPVAIKRFSTNAQVEGCQILYIGAGEVFGPGFLNDLAARGILTIGESPTFLDQGGAIRYHFKNNRVHFSINLPVIHRLNLKPSSQLLKIAKEVVR